MTPATFRRLLPMIAALAVLPAGAAHAQRIQRLDGTTLSTHEAETFARATLAANHVTGAQIAVIQHGKLAWSAAFGYRHLDPPLPMTTQTNTWAASITKAVFATYVMQLVERGEFDLDNPIAAQLSGPLNSFPPFRETAAALVRDPRWPRVTPRMLLSHTSGLANVAIFEPDKQMHLHADPGVAFRYSGDGLNIVQFVIEQQKGKPLDELMQAALFTPLRMTQTGMTFRPEFAANVADRFDADGKFHAQTRRFPARAAGNMSTSVDDLARFLIALLHGSILKPETVQRMLTPQVQIRSTHQFPSPGDPPASAEAANAGLAYGLGWGLLTKTRFGPAFFKEGHGDGAQNYLICFEKQQSCMVLLTNSDNGELAFRPLLEKILGDTVTPWEWEGYTPARIAEGSSH